MSSPSLENNVSVLYDALDLGLAGSWDNDGLLTLQRPPASAKLKKIKFRSFSANIKNNIQNITSPNLNCDLCCNIEILNETTTAPEDITTDELSSLPKKLLTTISDPQKNELWLLNQTGLKVFNNQYSNTLKLASYNIPLNNTIEESIDKGLTRAKVELMKLLGLIIDKDSDNDNYEYTNFYNGRVPERFYKSTDSFINSSQIVGVNEQTNITNYKSFVMFTPTPDGYVLSDVKNNSYPYTTEITGSLNGYIPITCIYETYNIGRLVEDCFFSVVESEEKQFPSYVYTLTTTGASPTIKEYYQIANPDYNLWTLMQANGRTVISYAFVDDSAIGDSLKMRHCALLYGTASSINNEIDYRLIGNIKEDSSNKYKFLCWCKGETSVDVWVEDDTEAFKKIIQYLYDIKPELELGDYYIVGFGYLFFNGKNYNWITVYSFDDITQQHKLSTWVLTGDSVSEYGKIINGTLSQVDYQEFTIAGNTDFINNLSLNEFIERFTPYQINHYAKCFNIGDSLDNSHFVTVDVVGAKVGYLDITETVGNTEALITPTLYNIFNGSSFATSASITVTTQVFNGTTYDNEIWVGGTSSGSHLAIVLSIDKELSKQYLSKYESTGNPLNNQMHLAFIGNQMFSWNVAAPGEKVAMYVGLRYNDIPIPGTTMYNLSNSLLCVFNWNKQGTLSPYLPTIEEGSGVYNWTNSDHIQPNGIADGPQYIYYSAETTDNFIENIFKWDQTTNTITFPNIPLVGRGDSSGSKFVYGNLFFYITFSTSPEVISFDPNIKQGRLKDCSTYYSVYKQIINKTPSLYLQQYNFDDYFYINDRTYYDVLNTFLLLRNTDMTLKLICDSYPTLNNIVFYLNETSMIDFKEAESSPQEPNIKCRIVDAAGAILTPSAAAKIYSNITICVDWEFYS